MSDGRELVKLQCKCGWFGWPLQDDVTEAKYVRHCGGKAHQEWMQRSGHSAPSPTLPQFFDKLPRQSPFAASSTAAAAGSSTEPAPPVAPECIEPALAAARAAATAERAKDDAYAKLLPVLSQMAAAVLAEAQKADTAAAALAQSSASQFMEQAAEQVRQASVLGMQSSAAFVEKMAQELQEVEQAALRSVKQFEEKEAELTRTSGVTVEYEQRESYSWRWFILPTGNNAGVSIGLVMQRGDNDNFPRHGLVALATAGAVPPGSVSGAEYDPTTYTQHEDPVGPRFKYSWISLSEARPSTDWEVLTLGFDANASRTDPAATQVQLNNVLIGFRCNERDWSGEIPGCRYSLTATLLPFELRHGSRLTAPMAPGTVHVYRITLGTYDSLSLDIDRDGVNASEHLESTAGLVGAALLQRAAWSPPRTLDFPYNLSGASGDLGVLPVETAAMVAYQGDRLWADKGLVSLEGCLAGDAGCRQKPQPSGTGDTADDAEAAKQADLRDNPWAHVLPDGKGYAALHAGAPRSLLQKLCVGPGEGGVYYVTLYADATSGDGRLWAGDGTLATVGGSKGDALTGVDTTGWRRAFSARAAGCWCCEAGACAQQCDAFQGACAGVVMPNATARTVRGYDVAVSALVFTDGAVDAGEDRAGCVGYGQWRRYTITTVGAEGAGLVLSLDADVEGLYAANGRPPTYESHDAVARPPQRNLSIAGCDVTTTNVWHVAVHLGARGAYGTAYTVETLFTLRVRARSAAAYVGDVLTAQSCCGVINLWRVPYVPASHALRANVTVHSGAVHGVFVQYDSCPSYTHGDASQTCDGLCEVAWLTSWDEISGARVERDRLAVTVPMGETVGRNDERRAGAWYVGVKALAGEAAEYTVALSLAAPPSRYAHPYCSHLLRFCASETQHETADGVVTTAADARVPPLSSTSAAGRGGRGVAAAGWTVGVGVLGVAWLLRPR